MSKITMDLLKNELNTWVQMKKSMADNVPKGNIVNFGKYINSKYSFNSKALSDEEDHNVAVLLIMRDHVQEIK